MRCTFHKDRKLICIKIEGPTYKDSLSQLKLKASNELLKHDTIRWTGPLPININAIGTMYVSPNTTKS